MLDLINNQQSLTMIIPTRERSDFLERALYYYLSVGFNQKIIISDSSTKNHLIHNKDTVEKVKSMLNVSHEIYDEKMEIVEKIGYSLSHVTTPYVILGDDDDFFVPNTLQLAVDFLSSNHEYSCVSGESLGLNLGYQKSYGKIKNLSVYPQKSLENDNVGIRLIKHLSSYDSNWASVQRTNQLVYYWGFLKSYNWDIKFMEILPSCLVIIGGKAKKLNYLYMVRQGDAPKSYTRLKSMTDWASNPSSWDPQFYLFNQILSHYLACKAHIDFNLAKITVRNAFLFFFIPILFAEYQDQKDEYWPKERKRISKILNLPIIRIFLHLLRYIISRLKNHFFLNNIRNKILCYKLSRKIPLFKSDFHQIVRVIESENISEKIHSFSH